MDSPCAHVTYDEDIFGWGHKKKDTLESYQSKIKELKNELKKLNSDFIALVLKKPRSNRENINLTALNYKIQLTERGLYIYLKLVSGIKKSNITIS